MRRLRGEFALAEAAYRTASGHGREPQPGLALLRLAQGEADSAAATIRRAVAESSRGLPRVALLPAYVEIMLVVGDVEAADGACRELEEIAAQQGSEAIDAMSWQQLEAPYDAARIRALVGLARRLLGDEDSAALELQAARETFTGLGARPDLAALDPLAATKGSGDVHGLSPRESEVLRLVATKLGVPSRTAASAFAYEHHLA